MEHYNALSPYLKNRFGCKICKLSLSAGCTCPNRDGTLGTRGCMFCSGSGEFAASGLASIPEQLEQAKLILGKKAHNARFIAYFQEFTNTYGDVSRLEPLFLQAMEPDDVVALSIATRPDCLPEDILRMLSRLREKKPIFVELGLQTMHDETARYIRRGYRLPVFDAAVDRLHTLDVEVVAHMILGLPGETPEMIVQTARHLGQVGVDGVKLHLLHVLRGTRLEEMWRRGEYVPMDMEEYAKTVVRQLEVLRGDTVIARVGGDAPNDVLLAPDWCRRKTAVSNLIDRMLYENGTYEGRLYNKHG